MANAVDIANRIQSVIVGQPTAEVLMALSMVLGASEASAAHPDFENLMRLVRKTALWQFEQSRAEVLSRH